MLKMQCGKKQLTEEETEEETKEKDKDEDTTEEAAAEEEEEEATTPPKSRRTMNVKQTLTKTEMSVKKTLSKVKTGNTKPIPERDEVTPTITHIYGREHRNERVKQKALEMNTVFVSAM